MDLSIMTTMETTMDMSVEITTETTMGLSVGTIMGTSNRTITETTRVTWMGSSMTEVQMTILRMKMKVLTKVQPVKYALNIWWIEWYLFHVDMQIFAKNVLFNMRQHMAMKENVLTA